jgi:hypothetical protein
MMIEIMEAVIVTIGVIEKGIRENSKEHKEQEALRQSEMSEYEQKAEAQRKFLLRMGG